jgi:signal transduction histidine kinase
MAQTAARGAAQDGGQTERIEDRLERRNTAFDALFNLVEKLGTTFDLDAIVSVFLMTVMGRLTVERAALFLAASPAGRLMPCRSFGLARPGALAPIGAASHLAHWLEGARGLVCLEDVRASAGSSPAGGDESIETLVDAGFSNAIALADGGDLLGMLVVSDTVTGRAFDRLDEDLLRVFARVASITIRNALLYQAEVASKLELERFAGVKREFIGRTSRELRTPLTVLKSALWSLEPEETGDGVLVDMARDAVTRLQDKVEYILSLNDVRLDAGDFSLESCEISGLVEEALREIIPELEEKQVRVSVDDRAIDRKAMVDAAKLRIVLRSILDNAVNFVERGGTIRVGVRVADGPPGLDEGIEVGHRRSGQDTGLAAGLLSHGAEDGKTAYLPPARSARELGGFPSIVISVQDDGIGIPSEEIGTLAEPFTQASNSTNKNVKGLGIGLSVSQKIVAGHGGKLFCKSELGQGARFSIWLPLSV